MKWHKWNVGSIYPNFKGKFQVDIMSFSSYLEMKYSIFFEWAIFKTFATVTFHYRIYAQLDGSFILHVQQIPTDLGRKAPTKSHPKGDTSNVCRLCELFFRVFRGVLGMKTSSLLCFLGRTMTLPNCGVKPVRSQQDWLLVRRNSWNCPSTLCHTRKNHHHSSL